MNGFNITEFWELAGAGASVPAASLGVTDIVRRRRTLRTETCTLHREGAPFDGEPPFAPGSTVTVWRGGGPWFVGRVTGTPGSGDGQSESLDVVLSGPWWYLENLVYRQSQPLRNTRGSVPLSRVVLGQSEDGTRLTSGETVAAVLQYAIDEGAPFQIGTVEPSPILPLDELRNVTCAQAIRRVLRWLPDCVGWFDHSTLPVPTFHCRGRFSLPAVELTAGQAPLAAVRGLSARADRLAPTVTLHYERRSEDGSDVLTDVAPPGATGQEFGAWVATIPAERPTAATPGESAEAAPFQSLDELPVRGGEAGESLAAALYGARGVLAYSGSVVLAQAEAGGEPGLGLGTTLNLLGTARAAWATMRALVIEDETRVADGRTTVRFGVPEGTEDTGTEPVEAEGGLSEALLSVQPGVVGREVGSPAVR